MRNKQLRLKANTDYNDFHFGRIFSEEKDELLETNLIISMDRYFRNENMRDRKIELLNLFAAAPEMLECIKKFKSCFASFDIKADNFDNFHDFSDAIFSRNAALDIADAIILKVEGK